MFRLEKNVRVLKCVRPIVDALIAQINAITPKAGLGIDIDESAEGTTISTKTNPPAGGDAGNNSAEGGGTVGDTEDIYGALNGQPAIFHVVVSAPAEPL